MKKIESQPVLDTPVIKLAALKYSAVLALTAAVFWGSCKRTDPPTDINDPVFSVQFDNDSSRLITAGQDNIYLYTRYDLEQNVVHSFNYFSRVNCPNGDCPGSLGFEFWFPEVSDTAFFPGSYPFAIPDSVAGKLDYYNGVLVWKGSYQASEFQEFILDNANPLFIHQFSPDSQTIKLPPGVSFVSFTASSPSGPQSIIHRQIKDTDPGFYPAVNITASKSGNTFELKAIPDFPAHQPVSYFWSTFDTAHIIQVDTLSPSANYSVTLTDGNGRTADASFSNLPFFGANGFYQTANFNLSTKPVYIQKQIPAVSLQWVDANGLEWRSDRGVQSGDSYFRVLKQEVYESNENGVPARKLTVEFQCKLYNPDGGVQLIKGSGVVAMARP